jgi:hypothetical protein
VEDSFWYPKSSRRIISDAFYGLDGLTSATDVDTFEFREHRIKEHIAKFDEIVGEKNLCLTLLIY